MRDKYIHFRTTEEDLEKFDYIIANNGSFDNRSDFITKAINTIYKNTKNDALDHKAQRQIDLRKHYDDNLIQK